MHSSISKRCVGPFVTLVSARAVVLPGGERVRTGAPATGADCDRARDREGGTGEESRLGPAEDNGQV